MYSIHYRAVPKSCPLWPQYQNATLGVSMGNKRWHGEKFVAILAWAESHFATIRIDVSDALYRYNIMADGKNESAALHMAEATGALWLAQHQDAIHDCKKPISVVRWRHWLDHPDFATTLVQFQHTLTQDVVFHEALEQDVTNFLARNTDNTALTATYCRAYILEELAVITLQARAQGGARLYPGAEMESLKLVRKRLVATAPLGLEHDYHVMLELKRRNKADQLPATQKIITT